MVMTRVTCAELCLCFLQCIFCLLALDGDACKMGNLSMNIVLCAVGLASSREYIAKVPNPGHRR